MPLGLTLYRALSLAIAPFAGLILQGRVRSGKEDPSRLNQRMARDLPARPAGPLIWLHAASVGESQLLLEIARIMAENGKRPAFLFTCQTLTAAQRIAARLRLEPAFADGWALQQMAPLDTPGGAFRFVAHWAPDLAIIAEGEIWPNLLLQLQRAGIPSALVNARMTQASISGWSRWAATAGRVIGSFTLLLASDRQTAIGLECLVARPVACPGNLKMALPAPTADPGELAALKAALKQRPVLLAASTHDGEEALVLEALLQMNPRPFAIIAPRHPERGDAIAHLLAKPGLSVARRSRDEPICEGTDILLADTMGEMGLWYRLANTVYLGGGHAPGVGGHNPLEALHLGKPVMTGDSLFNFKDLSASLVALGGLTIVRSVEDIVEAFPLDPPGDDVRRILSADANAPMDATLKALSPFLDRIMARA